MGRKETEAGQMLELAVAAARLAGRCALEQMGQAKVSVKNHSELVTTADGLCQELIINKIMGEYPGHGFISEEGCGGGVFYQRPSGVDPVWWIIDPIDGTNNYAHGLVHFSVSIAAMREGVPVAGVVFEPATDSMFTAAAGSGACLNSLVISAGEEGLTKFANFGINSEFRVEEAGVINQIMYRTRTRNFGSTALHLVYTACGGLAGTIMSNAKLWDIAAGAFIAQAAGVIITDLAGRDIFPFEVQDYAGRKISLLAANRKTHPQVMRLLQEYK